jgi:hypothetical protein
MISFRSGSLFSALILLLLLLMIKNYNKKFFNYIYFKENIINTLTFYILTFKHVFVYVKNVQDTSAL